MTPGTVLVDTWAILETDHGVHVVNREWENGHRFAEERQSRQKAHADNVHNQNGIGTGVIPVFRGGLPASAFSFPVLFGVFCDAGFRAR